MTEADRRQRVITSTPHISPEEVANRAFATSFRGFSESEVRSFLKRVSEELVAARDRERELAVAVDDLEEQLRAPRPLSEQELLDALGEETARLLRSAREAGDDIRRKAEERAARTVDEAQEAADRMRAEAAEILDIRTREAEARGAEVEADADAHAANRRQTAEQESEAIVEAARRHGREMLDEAKHARERVLADLVRRRALLQAQVEELRSGRDRLLEAYRVVKRTFLEATEALVQVEARVAAERSSPSNEPIDIEAEVAAEVAALDATIDAEPEAQATTAEAEAEDEATASVVELPSRPDGEAEVVDAEVVDADASESTRSLADVDSLFARIRAGQHGADAPDTESPEAVASVTTAGGSSPSRAGSAEERAIDLTEFPEALPIAGVAPDLAVPADQWRQRRAGAVGPLLSPLVKRAKRTAQDDQNALLDAVRRHKGRPTAAQVLPAEEDLVAKWVEVLGAALDKSYGAGRRAAGGEVTPADDELGREAALAVVAPLRERLTAAIDSSEAGDTGLVERIGARYREWKNQSLERAIGDVLAFVWARGVYDASPEGAVLQWIPPEEGHCPDCDDNALEPTVKGKTFPTGQPHPPAHPGCRCLLAPQ
jgi:DivIVA domain-containing protein